MKQRRVVITGMGVISPLGLNVDDTWRGLLAGKSGIGPITLFDASDHEVKIAGEAPGFDAATFMPPKEARRTDRFVQLIIGCLEEALANSRLNVADHDAFEIGAILGSGMGGINTYTKELDVIREMGPRRVSPFLIPSITVDLTAVHVALRTGARGPSLGVASACATSADSIGVAFDTIRAGHAQAMFTGGSEAAITPIAMAAFDRMRALSHHSDDPAGASRPFDATRDGFVLSEGGAVLVLEELDFALRRGAEPLAELLSYAATSDAMHATAPDPEGLCAGRCMSLAMQRAGVRPDEVGYINAHGTSTPAGDPAEVAAVKRAFGNDAAPPPMSSTKSMTGHLLGGTGALEAAICVQALRHGMLPPTINYRNPDPACDLDFVPNQARRAAVDVVMSNSMGFGGHNVSLVLRRYQG